MKMFFAIIALFAVTVAASAQIVSSRSVREVESSNYDRWSVAYASMGVSVDVKGTGQSSSSADGSCAGVRLQWIKGISLSSNIPLYLEVGLNGQYNAKSESESGVELSTKFLKFSVPVNIAYKYNINEDFAIQPYTGVHFTGNVVGNFEQSYNGRKTYSYFDKEDMGGSSNTASRFQAGWQIGVGVLYKKLYLGFEYGLDFNKYVDNDYSSISTHDIAISLGIQY